MPRRLQPGAVLRWFAVGALPASLVFCSWWGLSAAEPVHGSFVDSAESGASKFARGPLSPTAAPPSSTSDGEAAATAGPSARGPAQTDTARAGSVDGTNEAPRSRPSPERAAAELSVSFPDLGVVPLPPSAPATDGSVLASGEPSPRSGPCGGVQVRLITTSADPNWASASIAAARDEPARSYRVGERVGRWRIDAIEWDRVWLVAAGARCAATLHEGLDGSAVAAGSPTASPDGPLTITEGPVAVGRLPFEIAQGIRRRSQTEIVIDPRCADQLLVDGADWLAGTPINLARVGDEVIGLELGAIASGSLLAHLGLESGDILRLLEGRPVRSVEQVLAVLREARPRNGLVARIARAGGEYDLEVAVRALGTD